MKQQSEVNVLPAVEGVGSTNGSTAEAGSEIEHSGNGRRDTAQGLDSDTQESYHRQLFAGWYQLDSFWQGALDLIGDKDDAIRLGLDQLGHFGPRGVALVAERLVAATGGQMTRVVELGSGFGGAIRHMGRLLRAQGISPWLIGVEFVAEHCELAAAIGRTMGDTVPLILNADAMRLPFSPGEVDAVFVAGSASHFSSMGEVLAECHRVLRPGGVLVMTEEVSLRPQGGPEPGADFARLHPPEVFRATSPEQRRAQIEAAGLKIETFEQLTDWAVPLLRQRVNALKFMGKCATQMFGLDAYEQMIGTLTSAADEYERGTILPTIIVARRVEQ
jgi:SAM-dependent methyltransferase